MKKRAGDDAKAASGGRRWDTAKIKNQFQTMLQVAKVSRHHVAFSGHGPPHKRMFACEMKIGRAHV